jgi:isopenicillin-N N-acyltransferase-like protein
MEAADKAPTRREPKAERNRSISPGNTPLPLVAYRAIWSHPEVCILETHTGVNLARRGGSMRSPVYPHIRVSGGPRDRGRQYGEQARERVRRSVEAYAEVFAVMAGLEWNQVRQMASAYLPPIEAFDRRYAEELRGIAEGSAFTLEDILAVNVRTEVMYAAKADEALRLRNEAKPMAECTSVAALPSATDSHHTLAAQNWDWLVHTADTTVVLEALQDDGPAYVTVVEAGLLGKLGFNSSGIALLTNAVVTDHDVGAPGVPFHICLRALLDARNLPEALSTLQRGVRSSSANYLLASREGLAVDVEARPGTYANMSLLSDDRDVLMHTNHFVDRGIEWSDVGLWWMPDSPFRLLRARSLLDRREGPVTVEMLQRLLSDHANHPLGVCAHPDVSMRTVEQSATIASVIMDLDTFDLWLADGNPCDTEFRRISYAEFFGAAA